MTQNFQILTHCHKYNMKVIENECESVVQFHLFPPVHEEAITQQ
jgi:hypothetical protein